MSELVAIWVTGLVLLVVLFGLVSALLRFTASGRAQQLPLDDLFKVLALCIAVSCAVYSVLALVA